MSWTSLAERFDTIPLILAGPIVRRTEPRLATVWVALKEARVVTLCVYARNETGQLTRRIEGTRATVRLGDNLHVVAVTARTTHDEQTLAWGELYYYDLFFSSMHADNLPDQDIASHLATPDVLSVDAAEADPIQRLVYPGHPLPGFVLPAEDVHDLCIVHGSCRKPHGVGREMLSALDTLIAAASDEQGGEMARRPQQLFLTGDQIYADDVAAPLLFALMDASRVLFAGNKAEILPEIQRSADQLPPTTRREVAHNKARLTSSKTDNHLLSLAEYAAMYLFTWSDVLWPSEQPQLEEIWAVYPELRTEKGRTEKVRMSHDELMARLQAFRAKLPGVRRALANISTYMICDDHDVTDDLFLDGAWCQQVLGSTLGRRIMRNGLLAYTLFQAWGNTPTQFEGEHGTTLLRAIDAWRGDDASPQIETIEEIIGLPEPFSGIGSLQRPECALHWHYTYPGPNYQLIAMDTRIERYYRAPTDFPGLLSPQAMRTQLAMNRRDDAEVTIIFSATPVLGIDFMESIQFWSRWQIKDNYSFDREAWALEWGTFQQLLRTISSMQRVVFLSGDVHYAFGSSLEYWNMHTKETARLVNYTSSPLCNEGSGSQISVLAIGYPRLRRLLQRGKEPTLDFFIWDVVGQDHHTLNYLLTQIRKRIYRFWWAIPRLVAVQRSSQEIVLPARGWLKGAFDILPPDRSYRLRYLPNTLLRNGEREHRPHTNLPRLIIRPLRASLRWITLLQSRLGAARRKLQGTNAKLEKTTSSTLQQLQQPTDNLLGQAISSTEFIERRLEHPRQRLVDALLHSETWLSRWKAGSLIVGYNNIGEISFDWRGETREVRQKLWWYNPDDPEQLQSTEYCQTLMPPRLEDEPALP
ncbi:MAG: hypothetical protein NVSMB44_47010 [Ktedonobacteraceae bacterium]